MSTREMALSIFNTLTEEQLQGFILMFGGARADDAFCEALLQDYLDDDSSDKHEAVPLEAFAASLGVDLA